MKKLLFLLPVLLILGCTASCPSTCDDGNACTTDSCSEETNFECVHDIISDCCGNGVCEASSSESFIVCSADCPDCDDDNACTTDSFDYVTQACDNTKTVFLMPVMQDDFESNMSKWNDFAIGIWNVSDGFLKSDFVPVDGGSPPVIYAQGINAFKGDYSFSGKFKIEEGALFILLRMEQYVIGYSLGVVENAVVLIKTSSVPDTPPEILVLKQTPVTLNTWLEFKAVTIGDRIIFFIEDTKVIDYVDKKDPYLSGNYGFSVSNQVFSETFDSGIVYVDDVSISEVNSTNYLC